MNHIWQEIYYLNPISFFQNLNSFNDKNNHKAFVGEIAGPFIIPLYRGVFFSLFTAREGMEELQMSILDTSRRGNKDKGRPPSGAHRLNLDSK